MNKPKYRQLFFISCILVVDQICCLKPRSCTSKNAYVTMAVDDVTAIGAMVLQQSLTNTQTNNCIVAMVTDTVSWLIREMLDVRFDKVVDIKPVKVKKGDQPPSPLFGKLRAWSFKEYDKIVYLHSDTIVLRNVDELFQHPELSAVPEATWTDVFNSGVMVIKPSTKTFKALKNMAKAEQSYDDTDQGTLNMYFSEWHRLSCIYNAAGDSPETAVGAYHRFGHRVKIVRFNTDMKPWLVSFNLEAEQTEMYAGELGLIPVPRPFYERWWQVFMTSIRPHLDNILKKHNMAIVQDGPRIFLGDPYTGLHVQANFFVLNNRSYPKFLNVKGKATNNQYCTQLDVFLLDQSALDVRG
ncbi:glycogenin-1-like [Haliotis rufescens]|uniref:glycogenin-1-like n=1 Tax=Haliotis rufescens TaxID=6454 RepID=UPI00201EADA6|nr:glycogenin-1-like [Haliotis rufescens]